MGDEYPRHGAFDGGFEVPGEPAAAAEPGEGALDHPAAGKEFKAFGDVGPLDDLDGPFSHLGQGFTQFVAGIAPVGEDVSKPRIERTDRGQVEAPLSADPEGFVVATENSWPAINDTENCS